MLLFSSVSSILAALHLCAAEVQTPLFFLRWLLFLHVCFGSVQGRESRGGRKAGKRVPKPIKRQTKDGGVS